MPRLCAAATADAIRPPSAHAVCHGNAPARSRQAASVSPSRYSITMYARPLSSTSKSNTSTIPGWRIDEVARASRKKRRTTPGSRVSSLRQDLDGGAPRDRSMLRKVHHAHAALAECGDDFVVAKSLARLANHGRGLKLAMRIGQSRREPIDRSNCEVLGSRKQQGRCRPRQPSRARRSALEIQVGLRRAFHDELEARLDVLAHQLGEDAVGLLDVVDGDAQQAARRRIERRARAAPRAASRPGP